MAETVIYKTQNATDPRRSRSDQIKELARNSNDLNQLIGIYRGQFNNELGDLAHETNAVAGDRIAELTGIDRNIISSLHNDEIIQAAVGQTEKKRIEEQAARQRSQIDEFAEEYEGRAGEYRKRLADSLLRNNQEAFELANPYILEDLNRRGLFTSQTAVNSAQADALKELEVDRQNRLIDFDRSNMAAYEDLKTGGISALIGGNQSALDAALNARRMGLERAYSAIDRENEISLAKSLAKRRSKDALTNALIGAGSEIASSLIPKRK